MKQLQNFSGGRGFYVEDVKYLQEQLDRLKSGGYSELGAFVLSGCNVDGTSLTPGMVYINDKMIYYAGASNVTFPCYLKEGAALQFGERYYDIDDVQKPAFKEERLDLVTIQPGAGQYITIQANNSKQTFLNALDEYLQSRTEEDFAGPDYCQYRKDNAGFVHIYARFYATGNDQQTTYQLPDGFRPAVAKSYTAHAITFIEGDPTSNKSTSVAIAIPTTGLMTAAESGNNFFVDLCAYIQFKAG